MESAATVAAAPLPDETPRRFGWVLLDVSTMARESGLRRATLYQAIRSGSLAPVRWVGRRVFVRSDVFEKWTTDDSTYVVPERSEPPARARSTRKRSRRGART